METRFTIEFGDHRHRRTGFLSNASRYSFVLDNKEWPSVEHYVYAQSFKGTPFEEQLRCTPSSWYLRFLIRGKRTSCEKNGRLIKTYTKPTTSRNTLYWYQKAIPNKFFQNQRIMERLLNTGNARLVDVTCPYTGAILEQIRTQCYQERFQKNLMYSKRELEVSPDIKDVLHSSLTIEDYAIINGLINKAWGNVKKTEQNCIYVEFLENLLLELYPKRAEFIIMLYQMRNPQMISQMTNFSKIVHQVSEIFQKQDPYQVYDLSGSYLISEVLRWHKMYASPDEASQFLYIVAPNFLKPTSSSIDTLSPGSAPQLDPVPDLTPQVEDITLQLDPPEITPQVKGITPQLDPPEITPQVKGITPQLDPPDLTPQVKGLTSQLAPPEITPQVKVLGDLTSQLSPPEITNVLEPAELQTQIEPPKITYVL